MPDTGWVSPGTIVDNNAIGNIAWTNPENAVSSNNQRATALRGIPATASHYLQATNYNFSIIPDGSTITGVEASIERSCAQGSTSAFVRDNSVRLVIGNVVVGSDLAYGVTDWPLVAAEAYANYGGSSNLWGNAITAAQVKAANFGVVISASYQTDPPPPPNPQANVDHIRMKVYYTDPVTPTYIISGIVTNTLGVGIQGVTMGGLPTSTTTDVNGNYSCVVTNNWNGTVTPSKSGYSSFSPASRTYVNVTSDQVNQNYEGTLASLYISGKVTTSKLAGIANVTLSGLTGNPVTDANGDYSATVAAGFTGTATPTKVNYTFAPATRDYSNVSSNQSSQNYVGAEGSIPDDPDQNEDPMIVVISPVDSIRKRLGC